MKKLLCRMCSALMIAAVCLCSVLTCSCDKEKNFGEASISITRDVPALSQSDADKGISASTYEGYHAMVADVQVSFTECDINRKYTLELSFDKNAESIFACPDGDIYMFSGCSGVVPVHIGALTDYNLSIFDVGKAYVGVSRDGVDYEWRAVSVIENSVCVLEGMDITPDEQTLFVKVIYYINYKPSGDKYVGANDDMYHRATYEEAE